MMPFEKNSDFTSADVAMLGHGFGVSQRLKFYDQHLEKYQFLPLP